MGGYTKLFSEIVTSSIWNEDDKVRITWITLLALSNADGFVSCVPTSLALMSRVPLKDCLKAIERLSKPDPESRTPDHEGRRIEKVMGGWIILNYPKYRERISDDPYTVAARQRQQKHRQKLAEQNKSPPSPPLKSSEAEAEAEAGSRDVTQRHAVPKFIKPTPEAVTEYAKSIEFEMDGQAFVDFYVSKGWMVGKSPMKDWQAAVRTWKKRNTEHPPATTGSGQRKPYPGELMKQLAELRQQRATIYNRHEENGKIPESKPQARKEHSELCSKIRELETQIRTM